MRSRYLLCMVLIIAIISNLFSQKIDILGKVSNKENIPQLGVIVKLQAANLSDTTGSDGIYHLYDYPIPNDNIKFQDRFFLTKLEGANLFFAVKQPKQLVRIEIFDLLGRTVETVLNEKLLQGNYVVNPLGHSKSNLSKQVLIIRLKVGEVLFHSKLINVGHSMNRTFNHYAVNTLNPIAKSPKGLDTLIYLKEGQVITSKEIGDYIDTIPDLFIIQRDIYGTFIERPKSFKTVNAIISGDSIPDSTPKVAALWYNEPNQSYSGFVYFVYSSQVVNYSVHVKVFNVDSNLIGRSVAVNFPSIAGDVAIPAFNPNNANPLVTTRDTIVSINDSIRLNAFCTDSFGGIITKWEWSINGAGFVKTSKSDTIIIAPPDSNPEYNCMVRITDNDGNSATDTMKTVICRDVPFIDAGADTTVSINAPVTFSGSVTQKFGVIKMYKWDFNGDGVFDDSSSISPTVVYTYTHEDAYSVKFYVRDDDRNEAFDVRSVSVGNNAPEITSIRPDTTISIQDSIILTGTAIDNDGSITSYAWDFNGDGSYEYTDPINPTSGYRYQSAGVYNTAFLVTDNDNKKALKTVNITVVEDIPIAHAGNDTAVFMNTLITLRGTAEQQFGTIIKWEWSIGNSGFKKTASSDTTFLLPNIDTTLLCILRVTDDDQNTSIDSVNVTSGKWDYLGGTGISVGAANYNSLLFIGDTPFVSFAESANNEKLSVMKFSNNKWEYVGSSIITDSAVKYPSLAAYNNMLHVGYLDVKYNRKPRVIKYNGSSWEYDTLGLSLITDNNQWITLACNSKRRFLFGTCGST